jgi:SAM-dependent methyltransferase
MEVTFVTCPLCRSMEPVQLGVVRDGRYFDCPNCSLIFLDPEQRLSPEVEKARYETHENRPDDPRYRAFLDRLAGPLVDRLPAGARGLDFGSGPGPTLSVMLEEQGFPMRIYDPFFAPDSSALKGKYDFITCTEALEHLFHPGDELERLAGLLRPGGYLAVMTEVLGPDIDFAEWWYRRDPTHVAFYREEALEWIGERFGWKLEIPRRNVAIYQAHS